MAQASTASKNVAYDPTARRTAFGWSTDCTICLASQVERTLLPAMGAILAEQVSACASLAIALTRVAAAFAAACMGLALLGYCLRPHAACMDSPSRPRSVS